MTFQLVTALFTLNQMPSSLLCSKGESTRHYLLCEAARRSGNKDRQLSINQTQRQNKRGQYLWLSLTNNIHPISQNKRTVQPTCLSTKVPASACAPTTQEHSPPQGQANILLKLQQLQRKCSHISGPFPTTGCTAEHSKERKTGVEKATTKRGRARGHQQGFSSMAKTEGVQTPEQ